MPDPAVSVVVPTYNRAESLRRLLDAIAGCQPPEGGFEVIVVDDGSSDDTAEVAESSPVPVRYVRQANGGPAAARNAGVGLARGGVVVFTDDDCQPSRTWLVELVAELDRRPELSALGGTVLPIRRTFLTDFVQLERLVGHGSDERGVRFLITANAAFRTSALREVGGFDERFPAAAGEDTDLSFRVAARGHRLGVTTGAVIRHDHPTRLKIILRTYFKHGVARDSLARFHPDLGLGAATRGMLGPSYWVRRYRYYRKGGAGPLQAVAYVGLRLAGLATYAAGIVSARRRRSTADRH